LEKIEAGFGERGECERECVCCLPTAVNACRDRQASFA